MDKTGDRYVKQIQPGTEKQVSHNLNKIHALNEMISQKLELKGDYQKPRRAGQAEQDGKELFSELQSDGVNSSAASQQGTSLKSIS